MVGLMPLEHAILVRIQVPQQLLTKQTVNFETRGFARPSPPLAGQVSFWRRLRRRYWPN